MKILIAYYSRTGITKKVAESLRNFLGADLEEIKDTVERGGAMGYLLSGRDAMQRKLTKLQVSNLSSEDYDLVIVGTPIWGWNMSTPVRTYLTEQKNKFKEVAFFCTMDGSGNEKAFREMGEIIGQKPKATLALKTLEVVKNNFTNQLKEFGDKLKI